jgi:hypothetical protein
MTHRWLILLFNACWLALAVVALPAVTGRRVGGWHLGDAGASDTLGVLVLGLGLAFNLAGRFVLGRDRRTKAAYLTGAAVFGLLLLIKFLALRGVIGFDWLRDWLLWLKKKLEG